MTTNELKARILELTWTRRYSLDGLRRALGMGHEELVGLALAVRELMQAGKVRTWGNTGRRADVETLYIAS